MIKLFTGADFSAWLNKAAFEFSAYWPGTAYQKCTEELLARCTEWYPDMYEDYVIRRCRQDIEWGRYCSDDVGAIKGAVWTDLGKHECIYNHHRLYDVTWDGLVHLCRPRGEYGPIDTLPERPGVAVRVGGHLGVYIGGGYTVDWRRYGNGCCKSRVRDRNWEEWFEIPWVDYGEKTNEPAKLFCSPITTLGTRILEFGARGDDVRQLHIALKKFGLWCEDETCNFGPVTLRMLMAFQKRNNLPVNGEYDYDTHHALMKAIGLDTEAVRNMKDDVKTPADGIIREGSAVVITGDRYYSGVEIPDWIKQKTWIVHSVEGDKIVLGRSEDGGTLIMCPVHRSNLKLARYMGGGDDVQNHDG